MSYRDTARRDSGDGYVSPNSGCIGLNVCLGDIIDCGAPFSLIILTRTQLVRTLRIGR